MRTNPPLDPKLKIDLDRTSGENPLMGDGLVSLTYYKVAKSVAETSSKVREPETYDEAINDAVYANRQQEAIDEEL